jgi:hypothetical protein
LSTPLVVNNKTFDYPTDNQDPGWGQDASDWAAEVTEVLANVLAPGDILETTFDIADNTSVSAAIQGLAFDSTVTRAASITYSIYRTSTDTPAGNAESGVIDIVYDNQATAGTKWKMTQRTNGSSGVVLTISDLGQFSYLSSQIDTGSGGYSGTLTFSAKSTAI